MSIELLPPDMPNSQSPRLRALIELVDGDLTVFPIAQSDREAEEIVTKLEAAWGRRHED